MNWSDFWDRVSTCSVCHALVADHEEEAHRKTHAPHPTAADLARRIARSVVLLQDGVAAGAVIDVLRTGNDCNCAGCLPEYPFMRICRMCGDKRCPHVENHMNPCNASVEGAAAQVAAGRET
jgi:hypothetical protein